MVIIMNRFIVAGAASLSLATGSALGADMAPYTKARPMAAVYNWTGCYLGGTIGGTYGLSWGTATSGASAGTDTTPHYATSGWIGGGTLGCNYQFGSWVVGLEGDDSWVNTSGQSADLSPPDPVTVGSVTTMSWLATERVRLGYAWDAAKDGSTGLVYVTAGAAEANVGVQICNGTIACATGSAI